MDEIYSISFWVKNFGPIGAFLFTFGVLAKKICVFLAPHVTALVQSHIDFLKAVENNITRQTASLQKIEQTQSDHGEKLHAIHEKVVS